MPLYKPLQIKSNTDRSKHVRRFKALCFRPKQPDISKIETQVSKEDLNRSAVPSTPLSQAFQNCLKTYVVMETLRKLLSDLLKQQSAKSTCGCDLGITDQSSMNYAYKLECALKNEECHGRFREDPQSLRQMRRICRWINEEIKDELRALRVMLQYRECQQFEAEHDFIMRWQATAKTEFDSIMVLHRDPKVIQELDLVTVLENGVDYAGAVDCALAYLPTLYHQHRRSQMAYRGINSKPAEYGPSPSALIKMIKGQTPFHEVQVRTAFRCRSNVETVQRFLEALVKEAKIEASCRYHCKHASIRCHGHSDSRRHLELVAQQLNRIVSRLTRVSKAMGRLEARPQLWDDSDQNLVKQWSVLSGNFFGGLVTLRLQEVVERLVRMPIWEDQVPEPDDILKNIPYKMRPTLKYV